MTCPTTNSTTSRGQAKISRETWKSSRCRWTDGSRRPRPGQTRMTSAESCRSLMHVVAPADFQVAGKGAHRVERLLLADGRRHAQIAAAAHIVIVAGAAAAFPI